MTQQTLRIGVLGAAAIARDFTKGVGPSSCVEVVAVASRDLAKAQAFADELKVPRALGSYEALLADAGLNAIYVPLPNSMHCEWAIRAMQAGKHVLCEKPLGISAAEVKEMFAAAARYGRQLVEAYPYLAQPYVVKAREVIRDGAIGELKLIHACFAFPLSASSSPIRLDAALGGGALFDVGCYPISFIRMLTGERPARVHAIARWGETGVDRTMIANLEFASGVLAQISCSFDTALHRRALIAGTEGVIDTTYYNHTLAERPAEFQLKRGRTWAATTETITLPPANGFLAEAEAFAALVAGNANAWPGPHAAESIDIAVTLDAIADSARAQRPIDLPR